MKEDVNKVFKFLAECLALNVYTFFEHRKFIMGFVPLMMKLDEVFEPGSPQTLTMNTTIHLQDRICLSLLDLLEKKMKKWRLTDGADDAALADAMDEKKVVLETSRSHTMD
jgi:hypothetical protein